MNHDLLKLAELNEMAAEGHDDIHADLDRESAAALRAAHEEIQLLRDKTSALQQELDECGMLEKTLRVLIKRHEDALEWVSASKNHMKKSEGDSRGMFESWYGVGALSATHLNIRFADTPLAAIEAAMKEGK